MTLRNNQSNNSISAAVMSSSSSSSNNNNENNAIGNKSSNNTNSSSAQSNNRNGFFLSSNNFSNENYNDAASGIPIGAHNHLHHHHHQQQQQQKHHQPNQQTSSTTTSGNVINVINHQNALIAGGAQASSKANNYRCYTPQQQQQSQSQGTATISAASSIITDTNTSSNHSVVYSLSKLQQQQQQQRQQQQQQQQQPQQLFNKTTTTTTAAASTTVTTAMANYEHESASATQATQAVNQKIANLSSISFVTPLSSASASPSGPLGDLTNLTADERKKLEEIRVKRSKLTYEIQKLKEEISSCRKEMSRLDHASSDASISAGGNGGAGSGKSGSGGGGSKDGADNSAQRAKQLSIGKKKFNMDPKKGIEFLIENCLLKSTAESVAKFLYKGEGLNKTAIGTYLGEKIDFNLAVLDAFIELHDFKNLHLVQALRQFLWSFRLPGEAQKIDRMMEKFAARYCQQNVGVFYDTDTCFVLSFAIIMLNTSLHNPNVKDKMTADKFIAMNRGINNGGDLPRTLLMSLFESIRQEPFRIPEDDGNDLMHTFFNPDREGWLWKQGGRYKSWKRRWFILKDKCLYYFEYTTDKEPRGIIPLENVEIRDIGDRGGRQHCFELYSSIGEVIKACKTDTEGRVIEGRHTVYRLAATKAEEKAVWVDGIRASVSRSPFYEMLAARKRKIFHNK